ncbi:interleukin-13 [Choloepus didactylus]|uniref:interleukin-13 n=1 Tax=Choloepus didactylus TaxID=27675 RepID=UPI00189C5E4A|nr:interleukin-13 [Choloepus didactylus]
MALWLTVVIALSCFGDLASPGPVPLISLRELIQELDNVTQNQQAPLCNGSLVWSANLTSNVYCKALEVLINVSNCSAIQRTKRILSRLCKREAPPSQVSSSQDRHTKIEAMQFINDLLRRLKQLFRDVENSLGGRVEGGGKISVAFSPARPSLPFAWSLGLSLAGLPHLGLRAQSSTLGGQRRKTLSHTPSPPQGVAVSAPLPDA